MPGPVPGTHVFLRLQQRKTWMAGTSRGHDAERRSGETSMQSGERRVDPAGIVVGALLAVLAGIIVWDMTTLQITSTYGVGPKAMPIVVAAGLALCAAGNLYLALRGDFPEREAAGANADPAHPRRARRCDRADLDRWRLYSGDDDSVRHHRDGIRTARLSRRPRHRLCARDRRLPHVREAPVAVACPWGRSSGCSEGARWTRSPRSIKV